MSNNAAGLNAFLDTQLGDSTDTVWASAEKDNVIAWSVAELYPRIARIFDPTTTTITMTEGTYYYALPSGVLDVSRVEWVDSDSNERGLLTPGTWEVAADPIGGTGLLHVAPTVVDQFATGTLRLHAYGRYDVSSHLIPDDYVRLVLAMARAELYRRTAGDRVRYKEWMSRNQNQNVSVTEMLQFVNEADNEAMRLWGMRKVWRRPVPARV